MTSAGTSGSADRSSRGRGPDHFYRGYVLDLDGTVYLGETALPGAVEALAAIRAAGSRVVFLSNKPLEPADAYAAALRSMGIAADRREVITSLDALVAYLGDHPERSAILPISEPLIEAVLVDAGHVVSHDPRVADVVVVSWDRTFTYEKLERAFRAVRNGARIVATNPDPFCPTPDGGLPDCAALLAALEVSTGSRAEAVVGKPSRHMSAVALERIGVPAADVVMVGDRLLTDVAMARDAGMVAALVLTGATTDADLAAAAVQPDLVLADLGELIPSEPEGSRA